MTERNDSVAELAALARRYAEAPVDPYVEQAGRLALERRLRADAVRAPRRARVLAWAAAAAVVLATGGVVALRPRPLTYAVRGAHVEGPYVSAPSDAPVAVAFSDGSALTAMPSARVRVEEARVAGARVLVERGRVNVHVQHHTTSAWNFVAGPFDVHVTGTRFRLGWDPSNEVMELELTEGSVEVRGPLAEAPISVHAGQHFRGDVASRSMTVSDGSIASAAAASASVSRAELPPVSVTEPLPEAPPAAEPARSEPSGSRPATPLPAGESWSVLVARGQFETVIAKASERGTAECESSCGAADLHALADAARYTGRSAMAESALLSLRRRFGSTREGRSAAFLLGRLNEARGASAAAGRWYDTYLREAAGGELAAEALAGKMRAVSVAEGRSAAEPLAAEYLARYPHGVHAESARNLLAGKARK